ncbi:nitronate monooxygenase [Streptomyces sp. NBC_01217]|uniref:nitronate monooxygenase n=1 Tax=Streptomyces sp. NBC_01217 TaxID=2903779 RepID=UPI002E16816E|nr:nitronate monooxygenase [Streptomyces sp. NBC_01217]
MTRAFTGRPARALRNDFVDRYGGLAPHGYPALHHLTSPMCGAATAANDAERINLWAGTRYRHATAEPTGWILHRLASGVWGVRRGHAQTGPPGSRHPSARSTGWHPPLRRPTARPT